MSEKTQKVEKLERELATVNQFLEGLKGCKSAAARKYRQQATECKKQIEMALWKLTNPEQFENHRKALEGFVQSGGYGVMFERI